MNPAQRERRFRRIYEVGCLACRFRGYYAQPCQVHHLNLGQHAGQKRLGDEATIGLCPWHHVGEPLQGMDRERTRCFLGPSMALEPVKFREEFGTDQELLAKQNELIARQNLATVGAHVAAWIIGLSLGYPLGWGARDILHLTCSDSRFIAHLLWNGDMECLR